MAIIFILLGILAFGIFCAVFFSCLSDGWSAGEIVGVIFVSFFA